MIEGRVKVKWRKVSGGRSGQGAEGDDAGKSQGQVRKIRKARMLVERLKQSPHWCRGREGIKEAGQAGKG